MKRKTYGTLQVRKGRRMKDRLDDWVYEGNIIIQNCVQFSMQLDKQSRAKHSLLSIWDEKMNKIL